MQRWEHRRRLGSLPLLPDPCLLPSSPPHTWLAAVADFLRGISFYARIFELATGDEGTEEAAAEAATARGSGAAATA